MPMRFTGPWDLARGTLRLMTRLDRALERALAREALRYAKAMQLGIRRGSPGGQTFEPLSEKTIVQKAGKSKPLIRTSLLWRSIRSRKIRRGVYFAGIHRSVRSNRRGVPLANIGEVHELGANIFQKVTIKQFVYFKKVLEPSGAMGSVPPPGTRIWIKIPPRPFVGPVWKKLRGGARERIGRDILRGIGILPKYGGRAL